MITFDFKNWKTSLKTTIVGAVGAGALVVYETLIAEPPEPISWNLVLKAMAIFAVGSLLGIETPKQKAERQAKEELLKEQKKEEIKTDGKPLS